MHHTREIPRERWAEYLSLLSNVTRAQSVRIEADSTEIGEQQLAQRLPLLSISLEQKGSSRGSIEVTVGRPGEEITHRIAKPQRLYADESESGELECLDIEDASHTKTLIFFEPAQPAEELTGPQPHA